MFLCSDLGDGLCTSTNTATGHFQEKILYDLICNSSLETAGTDMQLFSVPWCALRTAELPGPPLTTELKPGALSWRERWHSTHRLFGGGCP